MTLLKDLLDLHETLPKEQPDLETLKEVRRSSSSNDMHRLLDKWIDQEKAYSWEGSRGVRTLTKLVKVLDSEYRDLDLFFSDNSGAIEAVLNWIMERSTGEWVSNLKDSVGGDEDDEEEDDEDTNKNA